MSTISMVVCDVKDCGVAAEHKQKTVSVAFTTEQTEGRTVSPYLEGQRLDFCGEHYQQYIDSLQFVATGAQGHNTFTFKATV
jgi:hypothetical protein